MSLRFRRVAVAVMGGAGLALAAVQAAAQDGSEAAKRFGAREEVESISLSPDGQSFAMVMPRSGQGNGLYVARLEAGATPALVLSASGSPERLDSCDWVSNDRLLCNVVLIQKGVDGVESLSRLIAVDATGGNIKVISKREGRNALSRANFGGDVIELLPEADGTVLVGRTYVPEEKIGSNIKRDDLGYGVDRVDTRSLASKRVESPKATAIEYIADGTGTVRIMGTNSISGTGYRENQIRYSFRLPGSTEWKPLGTYDILTGEGFNPYAVDPRLNVVYGFRKQNGLKALYKIKLDGTLQEEAVYARPDVDVDGLLRIGRSRRVVGVSYATEKRHVEYFDEELKKLRQSLGRALPGQPLVQIVDASADEKRLIVWAGGDVDPGRYYLLDRDTKKLSELVPARSQLTSLKLATVKPISYKAADGTMVPGYLTLPPDSSGKNIPAIVMPHGGPGARDEWGFDWLAQYYAHRGYAVLQPNFRGSAGYGDAWFQKNGFVSWQTAIGDVTDGGRWLVSQGIANPGKLAIVGWSYGGYAALQSAVVAPDLFKAVVAIAPVTDLAQLKEEAANFSTGRTQREFIGTGPHVQQGSPARRAQEIKAPVLQFHGTLDLNVPVSQARFMQAQLKNAGKKAELVIYPGLDHQLADSEARADMLEKSDNFIRDAIGD